METRLGEKGGLVGGASAGTGAACAAFTAEGARVVVHCHRGRGWAGAVAAELGDAGAR